MRILMFGGNGGLGSGIQQRFKEDKYFVRAPSSRQINFMSPHKLKDYVHEEPVHSLIYMAGVTYAQPIHKMENEHLFNVRCELKINAEGLLMALNAVLPGMRELGYGRIIYVSSVLSVNPIYGTGGYSASKCYGESLIRTAALENATKNITANTIRLGYTDQGMIEQVPEKILEGMVKQVPVQRLGTASELYDTMKYILTNEFLTGATIDLSGGLHI